MSDWPCKRLCDDASAIAACTQLFPSCPFLCYHLSLSPLSPLPSPLFPLLSPPLHLLYVRKGQVQPCDAIIPDSWYPGPVHLVHSANYSLLGTGPPDPVITYIHWRLHIPDRYPIYGYGLTDLPELYLPLAPLAAYLFRTCLSIIRLFDHLFLSSTVPQIQSGSLYVHLYCSSCPLINCSIPLRTTAMGVTRKVLKEGNGIDKPKKGDEVTIEYTGNLFDENAGNHNRGTQ